MEEKRQHLLQLQAHKRLLHTERLSVPAGDGNDGF